MHINSKEQTVSEFACSAKKILDTTSQLNYLQTCSGYRKEEREKEKRIVFIWYRKNKGKDKGLQNIFSTLNNKFNQKYKMKRQSNHHDRTQR